MSLSRSSLAAVAAAVLASGLTLTGVASAQDANVPVAGSAACTALVEADGAVVLAREAVDAAGTAVTDGLTGALANARLDATLALCSPVVETTEPTPVETTTPTPVETITTTPPADSAGAAIARVRTLIAALVCGPEFNARNGAVTDAFRDAQPLLTSAQQGALADEYNARLAVLGYCSGSVTPTTVPTTVTTPVTVDPTADDGSTANTSGTQVREVPEGSAQTGAL